MSAMPCVRPAALAAASLVLVGACHTGRRFAGANTADSTLIQRDIAWLADDAREGRATGTPGNDSSAAWIARRFAALGLVAIVRPDSGCATPCASDYLMRFVARPVAARGHGMPLQLPTENVVALLPGTTAALRGEYVIVGAHFDHLGRSPDFALDPEAANAIRNGADDNASGAAAVLELARLFARHPARRSIVFTTFTGEELGLLGSAWWADHSPVPLDRVQAMVNFDMVGRLKNDRLIIYGVATATELPAIVDSANVAPKLAGKSVKDLYEYSDALYSRKPGDTIAVIVMREGQRLTMSVTLAERGK